MIMLLSRLWMTAALYDCVILIMDDRVSFTIMDDRVAFPIGDDHVAFPLTDDYFAFLIVFLVLFE